MKQRTLGIGGPEVSDLGLGCMAMSEFYGPSDDAQSKRVLHEALELGVTFFDTADTYGAGHNERLLGDAIADSENRQRAFIATKFGIVRKEGEYQRSINGRPEYVIEAAEASLARLGVETIDLFYLHRVDVSVPIEDTVGAMAELVRQGKARHIGLSEASASTIRKAHAVHPLAAVQTEYSLWTRDVEAEVLPVVRELSIALVAYSPLGRGFLTGKLERESLRKEGDFRGYLPRFSGDDFEHNMAVIRILNDMAERKGVTTAQLALAWVLAQGDDVIPIPGTRRIEYLRDNVAASEIELSDEELTEIEASFAKHEVRGARYTPEGMVGVNR